MARFGHQIATARTLNFDNMETITADEFKKRYGEQGIQSFTQAAPVQQQQAGQSYGGQVSTAFNQGVDTAKQGYENAQQAANPFDKTAAGMKILAGGIQSAISPLAPVVKPATDALGAGVNKVADTLSDTPLFKGAAGNQVVGQDGQVHYVPNNDAGKLADFLADTSTVAGTVGGFSAAPKLSVPKVNIGTVGETSGGVLKAAGNTLKAAGEGAYGLTVPPSPATAKALMSYDAKQPTLFGRIQNTMAGKSAEGTTKPVTEANTAARMGLTGTEYGLGVKAKQITTNLWDNVIEPKLDAVKGKTNMKSFLNEIEKDIRKAGGDLTRRNVLIDALSKVREDYKNVSNINLKKLQNYKEGWAKFIPDASYAGKPIASALKEIHDLMASKARGVIYKNIGPEGKQAYLDYGNLQSIIESGYKSITGDIATKSLSKDVWQFVMNKAITPVATVAGKILYKTGEGLELLGKKGAKTVGDVVNN